MSIASAAAQQTSQAQMSALSLLADNTASGANGATSSSKNATGTSTSAASNPLQSLSGNFQDFLGMLMTQLKNQDPTSPLDSNQFTTELVQFSGVEQQINTNQSLTQLIQLTQGNEILQSSSIVGHQVAVQSNQLALQNGTAEIQFTSPTAGPAVIAVYNASGTKLTEQTVQAEAGQNSWAWDGSTASGGTARDGAYSVAVAGTDASGNAKALPFNVVGTATGVQTGSGNTVNLQLGSLSVGFSAIKSIVN